ncbi:MAG TPA: nucleotidyltransferase family protein [Planctomycetota bacterium]|nr:nucleotidyltransferase family protein [Planctomycetota bacterium]
MPDGSLLFDVFNGRRAEEWIAQRLDPLLDLAGDHGLIALVHDALQKQGAEISDEWNETAAELALNASVHVKAATELSAAFEVAKVDAVFAKGLALALTVYEKPALRPFVDIDVLIEPLSLKRADAVLREQGIALVAKSLKNPIECSYMREKLPGFPIHIDLHWSYTGDDGLQAPARVPIGEILSRTKIVNGIRVPSDEDTLLLAAGNMPRKAAQPLMLVVDFARMARMNLKWDAVRERATRWHVRTGLWLGLELARSLLNAPVNAEFLKSIEPARARREWLLNSLSGEQLWSTEKHKQRRYSFWFKLKCLDSTGDEVRAICALPKGIFRKLGLTRTWSQRQLR